MLVFALLFLGLWFGWMRNWGYELSFSQGFMTVELSGIDWAVILGFIGLSISLFLSRESSLKDLKESENKFKALYENSSDGIMLTSPNGQIVHVNKAGCEILGMDEEEVCRLGREGLVVKDEKLTKALEVRESTGRFSGELTFRHKSGKHLPVYLSSTIFTMPDTKEIRTSLIFRDISQQKQLEMAIQDTLDKRTYLLKEIHHRIKNNLSVISGLLELQAMENPAFKDSIAMTQNRIQSIVDIHDQLYNTDHFNNVEVQSYVEELVCKIKDSLISTEFTVDIELHIEPLRLNMDQSVPLGLMINELLTNTIKHAFHHGDEGKITIQLNAINDVVHFTYSDNGKGVTDCSDPHNGNSLGMKLIDVLSKQLSAYQIERKAEEGYSYGFKFIRQNP